VRLSGIAAKKQRAAARMSRAMPPAAQERFAQTRRRWWRLAEPQPWAIRGRPSCERVSAAAAVWGVGRSQERSASGVGWPSRAPGARPAHPGPCASSRQRRVSSWRGCDQRSPCARPHRYRLCRGGVHERGLGALKDLRRLLLRHQLARRGLCHPLRPHLRPALRR